jgi:ubiquinone/menaquinone biosynthesis C-methylase UbiE
MEAIDPSDEFEAHQLPGSRFFTHEQVAYLDNFGAIEWTRNYKQRTVSHLQVKEGDHLLEVGCGTGDDARLLAQIVGETGKIVGVDAGQDLIAEAKKRSENLRLPVEFFVGDVHSLDFPDSTFDGCRADQVFQHIGDPRKGLSEMVRVARSGARILICDPDWGTLAIDAEDRYLTRRILTARSEAFRSGWVGRKLPALFKEQGLRDICVSADTFMLTDFAMANRIWQLQSTVERAQRNGVISPEEATAWLSGLEKADREKRFFGAVTGFAVVGVKP